MGSRTSITPRLVIIEGKDKGKVVSLADGTAVLGRSKGDILIQDARISRSHVALHFDNRTGKLTFTDLKSLNGTLINGEKTESGELHDGDKLQLGNTIIDCQLMVDDGKSQITSQTLANAREREPKIESPVEAKAFKRQEPTLGPDPKDKPAARKKGVTQTNLIGGARGIYQKLPPPMLYAALAAVLILILMRSPGGGRSGSTQVNNLESDLKFVRSLQSEGKLDEAAAKLDAIKQRNPESSLVFMEIGNTYAAQQKNELAISAFQRAHGLLPDLPLVHIKLIRMYFRLGMATEASEEYLHAEKLIKDGKHSKELFIEVAFILLEFPELKQPSEKIVTLAKALQVEYAVDSTIGYKLEAQLYLQEKRYADALAIMEKGRQIDGTDEWLLENVVFAHLALRQLTDAEKVLDDWIRLKPDGTKALLVYAYLRLNEGSYAKSLPYIQKILQIGASHPKDPYIPEGLHVMAMIHEKLNQPEEASKFHRQACDAGFRQSCQTDSSRENAGGRESQSKPVGEPPVGMKNLVPTPGANGEDSSQNDSPNDDPTTPSE